MTAVLRLDFLDFGAVELDRVEFWRTGNRSESLVSRRGVSSSHIARTGCFAWTSAVKSLAILLVRTALSAYTSDGSPAVMEGTQKSLAASLDYALAKMPCWLLDMFGTTSAGEGLARRLFPRSNPERKRPGPVSIKVNQNMLAAKDISLFMNSSPLQSQAALESLLQRLLSSVGAQGTGEDQKEKNAQPTPLLSPSREKKDSIISFPYVCLEGTTELCVHRPTPLGDLVLNVFSREESLEFRQINHILEYEYKVRAPDSKLLTTLTSLCESRILRFAGGYYQIHGSWLASARAIIDFIRDYVQQAQSSPPAPSILKETSLGISVRFSSLGRCDEALSHVHKAFLETVPQSGSLTWSLQTAWWPLVYSDSMADFADSTNVNMTLITHNSCQLDKWVASFYQKRGVPKRSIGATYDFDFWLGGDILLWIEAESQLNTAIADRVGQTKNIDGFDVPKFSQDFLTVASPVILTVACLPSTATLLRRQILGTQ